MKPIFLSIEEVLAFHLREIENHGGDSHVRDIGLLSSAVAMPKQMYGGEFMHSTIFDMAAAYLFHIVNNHPFVDGNKRAGLTSAIVFLEINGISVTADKKSLYELVIDTTTNVLSKEDIAEYFKDNHANKN